MAFQTSRWKVNGFQPRAAIQASAVVCVMLRLLAAAAESVCSVSASSTGLSSRQRSMRGKRTAMPLLWRGLREMPSKPSSNTSVGRTLRTGPKLSTVVWRITASTLAISASVRPE